MRHRGAVHTPPKRLVTGDQDRVLARLCVVSRRLVARSGVSTMNILEIGIEAIHGGSSWITTILDSIVDLASTVDQMRARDDMVIASFKGEIKITIAGTKVEAEAEVDLLGHSGERIHA
jgi:hypothetical protein